MVMLATRAIQSLPSRGAWIEIYKFRLYPTKAQESLPSRGAWIEISLLGFAGTVSQVAPLAGSVDRNYLSELYLLPH